jgi:hypothetical protein
MLLGNLHLETSLHVVIYRQLLSMRTAEKSFSKMAAAIIPPMVHTRRALLRGLALGCAAAPASASSHEEVLEIGGASLKVSIREPATFVLPASAMITWVRQSAQSVTAYFGRFPVPRARIEILPASRARGVGSGKSFGNPPRCRIGVAPRAEAGDLANDWMLTHEMVHWGFPSVEERHHWIEEGTATYVEPIARARIGQLTAERVWGDMVRDMPQGLPGDGDQGLDRTPTWGRTYWGGALYCLLADVGIRKRTANRMGLEDALRAINRAGGSIDADWPLSRALEIGDRATGGSTLTDLYQHMSVEPAPVDLPSLWAQLGVRSAGGVVTFTDEAPLAGTRRAIVPTAR